MKQLKIKVNGTKRHYLALTNKIRFGIELHKYSTGSKHPNNVGMKTAGRQATNG